MGRNICQCPQPPGGQADCEAHQMAICWVEDGRARTRCIDPPRGVAAVELSNFILERVTGEKRHSKQQLSVEDEQILKTGEYEDPSRALRVSFRMPK
jgi:hypothetical protein